MGTVCVLLILFPIQTLTHKILQNIISLGVAVHRLVVEQFAGTGAVQHPKHTTHEHRNSTVHRVVHAVHAVVFLVANDTHNRTLRTDRTPTPAVRQAETYHNGTIDPRREKNVVARIQGKLVTESPQNAR